MRKAILVQLGFACFTLLAPLTRAAELKATRWEKEIAAFETMDRTNPPPAGAVLFVGSSSIRFWTNLASDFPEIKVVRRGFGGSYLPDVTHFADRIIFPYKPSKIVLYGGDNDIAAGHTPQRILADFRAFAKTVHSRLPKTKIYFLAIKPSPSRWSLSPQAAEANQLIQRYCRFRPKLEYIDVWTPLMKNGQPDPDLFERDRLHINSQGYALWTQVIRKALED